MIVCDKARVGNDCFAESCKEEETDLCANSLDSINENEGSIAETRRGADFARKVNVTRSVDDVDLVVLEHRLLACSRYGSAYVSSVEGEEGKTNPLLSVPKESSISARRPMTPW